MKAFARTARYDAAIPALALEARRGAGGRGRDLPERACGSICRARSCCATARTRTSARRSTAASSTSVEPLHGKELSYNNVVDVAGRAGADPRLRPDERRALAILKHNTPCGVGQGATPLEAWQRAFATDPESPFGGIIVVEPALRPGARARTVDEIFTEVLIAPDFAPDALEFLRKKKNRRLLRCQPERIDRSEPDVRRVVRRPAGAGARPRARGRRRRAGGDARASRPRTSCARSRFAWRVVKHVKSNAIVFAAADRTLAIGGGADLARRRGARARARRRRASASRSRARCSRATRSSRSRTASRTAIAAGATRRRAARRLDARRRGDRRGRPPRHRDGVHRRAPFPALGADAMRVLVVGGGGREHALAWKIAQQPARRRACWRRPGSDGIARDAQLLPGRRGGRRRRGARARARAKRVDLVVVGPEDAARRRPRRSRCATRASRSSARRARPRSSRASKAFAKEFMAAPRDSDRGASRVFDDARRGARVRARARRALRREGRRARGGQGRRGLRRTGRGASARSTRSWASAASATPARAS